MVTRIRTGGEIPIASVASASMRARCATSLSPVWMTCCGPQMHPEADFEGIRFRAESDLRYRLVHEGSLEGSSKLSYIVRLVEREMQLKLERKGYYGHRGYSSQTFQSDRPINARVFGRKVRRLLELPLKELVLIVRNRHLLGPKPGEPEFGDLDEQSSALAL